MSEINKYFETQLALTNQCKIKYDKKQEIISNKSKSAAEYISKKQTKSLEKYQYNRKKYGNKSANRLGKSIQSDYGDDQDLSSDAEDEMSFNVLPLVSPRTPQTINRILDDGDSKQYGVRIQNWRKNLNNATKGNKTYDNRALTADIQYILNGNKDVEEMRQLRGGLKVPKYIWKQLYKFQKNGVKWLWELHQLESGGLLGDEMGLGKTIQIIAFLTALFRSGLGTWGGLGPSIIVAPATVIYQWVSHFHYWCPPLRVAVLHHTGSHAGNHHKLVRDIHRNCGVLLVTYAGVVKYHKQLIAKQWHYLILDEGHKIRNPETQVSKYVKRIQTPHRVLITGSPMQNSLQELWSLFDFMSPGLLGTFNAFTEHFAIPITQGGYTNATEIQVATALEIAIALKNMITPYMLRRTKLEVQEDIKLPEKHEQVLFCPLTHEQRDLYMGYLTSRTIRNIISKDNKYNSPSRARLLVALSTLRKICNHPEIYLNEAQNVEEHVDEEKFRHWKRSGKMAVVHSLLKIWKKQGHRALIFSQSRVMLCILEHYLQTQGFQYLRMDGTVNVGNRQNLIKTFNENSDYLVFLSTTRVGGLGLNLTGADRVIIYDPDWNPATDDQAKERAWRIGQFRNVTVYRLLSAGTVEEKIYQRQIFKHFLNNKVFVDPNRKNYLSTSALQGLFSFEDLNREGDTETTSIFNQTKVSATNFSENLPIDKKSCFKTKIPAMLKIAKEINKKIPIDATSEKYEQKEIDLNMKVKEQFVDKITDLPLEALSESDIVNKHIKKDYNEKLFMHVLETEGNENPNTNLHDEQMPKKRKRSAVEENLLDVKKGKKVKNRDKVKTQTDDDYVLNKLFAKAAVKNALQHDAIVGLAEREKKHKLKELAAKRASDAVRAVKFSSK